LNKPHFDFRGNYEKYLPGVPQIPYFDQSVAYEAGKSETRTDKHKKKRGKKWLWRALLKFVMEKRRFGSGGFIFNVADSYFVFCGQTCFKFPIIMRQF
jgi:hypothetical protein